MMMIVLRLRSLLGLKSRWNRHFRPRPLNKVFFQEGGVSVDSWTPRVFPLQTESEGIPKSGVM